MNMNQLFSISNRSNSYDLFGSMTGTSSGSGLSTGLLSDWSMIKRGTYYKLAKSYYAKNTATTKRTEQSAEKVSLTTAKGNSAALKEAAATLSKTGSSSVFHTSTVVDDKTGKTSQVYDTDGIYKAVKNFVDSYNDVVKNTIDSDTVSVLRKTLNMTNITKANAGMLSKIGITVKSDNTLSIDEDAWKKADMKQVKSVFEGSNSYAGRIMSQADDLSRLASNAISSIDRGTYRASGSYAVNALSVGSMYDSIF